MFYEAHKTLQFPQAHCSQTIFILHNIIIPDNTSPVQRPHG